jgi:hypothetical protein
MPLPRYVQSDLAKQHEHPASKNAFTPARAMAWPLMKLAADQPRIPSVRQNRSTSGEEDGEENSSDTHLGKETNQGQ